MTGGAQIDADIAALNSKVEAVSQQVDAALHDVDRDVDAISNKVGALERQAESLGRGYTQLTDAGLAVEGRVAKLEAALSPQELEKLRALIPLLPKLEGRITALEAFHRPAETLILGGPCDRLDIWGQNTNDGGKMERAGGSALAWCPQGGAYRSELLLRKPGGGEQEQWLATIGKTYRYKWAVKMETWTQNKHACIWSQWLQMPDAGDVSRNPPLSFQDRGGRFVVDQRWDAAANSTTLAPNPTREVDVAWADLAPYGTDLQFDLEVKWSFGDDGYWILKLNGKDVHRRNGPNCYNDQQGPMFKMGTYRSGFRNGQRANEWTDQRLRCYWGDVYEIGG